MSLGKPNGVMRTANNQITGPLMLSTLNPITPEVTIASKKVTYDFARLMEGATQVSCSGFGQVMIDHM